MPTAEKVPQSTIDIQQRNLIFGAGPSGSTGTLLQAGKLFGNLDGELLQQYVLAIVAYLVGGGMHSYHEVMVIARMAGCPYKDGAYVPSLPGNFLRSADYEEWQADSSTSWCWEGSSGFWMMQNQKWEDFIVSA